MFIVTIGYVPQPITIEHAVIYTLPRPRQREHQTMPNDVYTTSHNLYSAQCPAVGDFNFWLSLSLSLSLS